MSQVYWPRSGGPHFDQEPLLPNASAYSCGIGTNGFLFRILAGVRTGCPLSATLFVLSLNPFLELINWLSDGPKISKTCVCADDVGSALRSLQGLRTLHSVLKLAEQVAGLHLKPSKCFLVVSAVQLSQDVIQGIKGWLADKIPEWKDFAVVDTGKYLGIWLGVRAGEMTWKAPTRKYGERILEIYEGGASALPSILRYNERALPVFSFIAQIFPPHESVNISSLEQRGIHKILHLPPTR